jgi:hypothetical protein
MCSDKRKADTGVKWEADRLSAYGRHGWEETYLEKPIGTVDSVSITYTETRETQTICTCAGRAVAATCTGDATESDSQPDPMMISINCKLGAAAAVEEFTARR